MLVFDIKRYAINDGPGIRITIFLKGCPLSCVWCHNPEGIYGGKEKLYTRKKCLGCEACVRACPGGALSLTDHGIVTDHGLCKVCGRCADICPSRAMEISGREYTADAVMREIEKETVFMDQSGGGVTFCGGEPLSCPDILVELLKRCGELGIHRAVDTTLFANPRIVDRVMDHSELLLIDLKHMDSKAHRSLTGVPNELIHSNIRRVAEAGMDFCIRIPLIEGINADEDNINRSAGFLASLPWSRKEVHLLPYHDIGKGKHEKRGTTYNPAHLTMSSPSEEVRRRCVRQFEGFGITALVGG